MIGMGKRPRSTTKRNVRYVLVAPPGTLVLPRTFSERVRLIIIGSGIAAFMGFMLSGIGEWKPVGLAEHVVHALGVEAFFTFGIFGILGVIWGLFAPSWLERVLRQGFHKVIAVFCVIGCASILSVIFYLLMR
jgi:hypothetical protein